MNGNTSTAKKQKTLTANERSMVKILRSPVYYEEFIEMKGEHPLFPFISFEEFNEFADCHQQWKTYESLVYNPPPYPHSKQEIRVTAVVVNGEVFYHTVELDFKEKLYFPVPCRGEPLYEWVRSTKALFALYDPNVFLLAQVQQKERHPYMISQDGDQYEMKVMSVSEHMNLPEGARKFVWHRAK